MSTDHKEPKIINNFSAAKRLLVKGLAMKIEKTERNRSWLSFSNKDGEIVALFNSVNRSCVNKLNELQLEKNGNVSAIVLARENQDDLLNLWLMQREELYEKALSKFHAGENKTVPSQDYFVGLNGGCGKHLFAHVIRANVEEAYFCGLTLNTKGNPIPKLLIPLAADLEKVVVDGRVGNWPVRAAWVVKEEKE